MRCSLKDGFVILLIFFFTPSEEKGDLLLPYKNSIADRSINFNDFSTMSRVEQNFDSFPKLKESDKRSHKIVKKQMTTSDYKHAQKNKRSVFSLQEISNYEDDVKCGYTEKLEKAIPDSGSFNKCETKKSASPDSRKQRDSKNDFKKKVVKSNGVFRRGIFSKKQKQKKINDNESPKSAEKFFEIAIDKIKEVTKKTESNTEKQDKKTNENSVIKDAGNTLQTDHNKFLKNLNEKIKGNENIKDTKLSEKLKNASFKSATLKDEYKSLKNLIGCKMDNYCRFPDIQDNRDYFECEADENGCIKLTHKKCPEGEIFSSRFLECLNPFFWKLVEREKRALWKKKKKQYPSTWGEGQFSTAWTDATHEEGKQFLTELGPKSKPKLLVYHLKVKKETNKDSQKEKKQKRHIPNAPRLTHSEISRLTQKSVNMKSTDHQLFPRSFVIRINKKDGKNDHETRVSEDENDDSEDNSDEEEDDEEDDMTEDTSDEGEATEEENEQKKTVEKGGIKEFFKSAKEAITNRARFNEPADTSFTLDKTNSYSKNKKLDGSEKDSRKILIDADIKVDKTLGKTLKRILGKRKDKDDGNVRLDESLFNDQGSQDQMESEQTIMYENLIRSNPRLKRYFLVSLGKGEN